MFGENDIQQIPWSSNSLVTSPHISVMGFFICFLTMNLSSKKDLRVFKFGLRSSHNAFFFFPKLTIHVTKEREREQAHLESVIQQRVV